jgi:hypothetical protein
MHRFHAVSTRCEKVVLASIFAVLAWMALSRPAAACYSVCMGVQPPDCLGCAFTAFRSVTCLRGPCNFCEEDSCSVEAFSPSQKLACEAPETKGAQLKALKVETLSPRS